MPKVFEIVVPSEKTKSLVSDIEKLPGLLGLQVQSGVSVKPKGDVINVTFENDRLHRLVEVLDKHKIGQDPSSSYNTSQPLSLVSRSSEEDIKRDSNESTWDEMELEMARESNATLYALILMAISGGLAAAGLATDTLHYVIAAMLLAPGFLPITRISLGLTLQTRAWQRGLVDLIKAYGVVVISAGVITLILQALGEPIFEGDPAYLPSAGILFNFWSKITPPGILVSVLAGIAGGILVVTNRQVLTAGVMVALSLVPAATFIGAGAVTGQWDLAGRGLQRWLLEVVIVLLTSLAVFLLYRAKEKAQRDKAGK